MKVFKNYLKLAFALIFVLCLCGCFNLGDFEDEQNYFDTFKEVKLISLDKTTKNYSVKDYFYTEEGVNDYECDVPSGEYIYAALKVEKNIILDELSLSFYSNSTENLYISVFLSDNIPSSIRGFDDEATDDEGNEITYDDPTETIDSAIVPLTGKEWRTTMLLNFPKNNGLKINEGQFLLIRFENNSWLGKQNGYNKIDFMLTNLLIRAQRS